MISPKEWKKAKELEKKERMLAGEKYCSVCETYKHTSDFHSDNKSKDGLCIRCKVCNGKKSIAWQRENPDKVRVRNRASRYKGYTEEHEKIMSCEICSVDLVVGSRVSNTQHIDHDHETGIIRGVICHNCNTMLGNAKDNPEILKLGAKYLEERTEP